MVQDVFLTIPWEVLEVGRLPRLLLEFAAQRLLFAHQPILILEQRHDHEVVTETTRSGKGQDEHNDLERQGPHAHVIQVEIVEIDLLQLLELVLNGHLYSSPAARFGSVWLKLRSKNDA